MGSNNAVGEWGHVENYNLSSAEIDLVRRRSERRQVLKKEYHRILFNPFTNMKVEGGAPFDPAFQRFASTRADYYPYFRPNRKNFAMFICFYWLPLGISIYLLDTEKVNFDARLRNAEIPWRYRSFKQ